MANKIVTAKAKNIRGSAQKIKIPVDVVRGMMVDEAIDILEFMPKKAAKAVQKVLVSAAANANHNFDIDSKNLKIKDIRVDKAMKIRRIKPKSRGMASVIHKHYSHITVELSDVNEVEGKSEKVSTSKKTKSKETKVEKKEVKTEVKGATKSKSKKTASKKKPTARKKAAAKK